MSISMKPTMNENVIISFEAIFRVLKTIPKLGNEAYKTLISLIAKKNIARPVILVYVFIFKRCNNRGRRISCHQKPFQRGGAPGKEAWLEVSHKD